MAQVFIWLWWGLAFLNLSALNLRWSVWQPAVAPDAPPDLRPFLNVLICVFFASVRLGWFLKWRLLRVTTVKRDCCIALASYAAVMIAGAVLYKGLKVGDVPPVEAAQGMINEVQADGVIRFQSLSSSPNDSGAPMRELRFVSSDFGPIEQMWSSTGQRLRFEAKHEASTRTVAYVVPLAEVVPPGRSVTLRARGYVTNQVRSLGVGEFEYSEQHWPANGLTSLRVETYRLPSGARVLETMPTDMTRRTLPDGRLELRTQKVIAPGGSISVRVRYEFPPR